MWAGSTNRQFACCPPEKPTPSELHAVRRGEAAYRRGDYVTLDEYFRDLDGHPRWPRKKSDQTHAGS